MKSRTSFFDKTVLRKDLLRFSPLWALYLIGGLLIMHIVSGFYDNYFGTSAYSLARDLNQYIGPMSVFSAIYGFLSAQLLFGDLHNSRLCNGLHALPLRREGWYLTHVTSGLLMGLVPPLVIALTLMPYLGQFWFTALLCWSGIALHYLFFFALAVFCMMCTGNRFAATAIYGLINFLSMIVYWFSNTIYLPLLPGVRTNTSIFYLFCPVLEMAGRDDFMNLVHQPTCDCFYHYNDHYYNDYLDIFDVNFAHEYAFDSLGGDWGYLLICSGVGIVLLTLGLMLYRRRHLERAGDFMAYTPMKPIFLWVYTLCVGAVLFYLGETFSGEATAYVFFAIGIAIGFFTGKMMLERTIRVFKGRSWAGLGILYAAVALSLLLTWVDPVGISRWVPNSEKVETVYLYDGSMSDYQLNSDRLTSRGDLIAVSEPEDIAAICELHSAMLQEHKEVAEKDLSGRLVTIQYRMKNGARISRTYRIFHYGELSTKLNTFMAKPAYLFGVANLRQLQKQTTHIYFSELGVIPEDMYDSLLEAVWKDAEAGNVFFSGNSMYIELQSSNGYFRVVSFDSSARNINQWLQQHKCSPSLLLDHPSLESLIDGTMSVYFHNYDLHLGSTYFEEFLSLLWQDCQNGKVENNSKWSEGLYVELETDTGWLSLALSPDSQSGQWLTNEFGSDK